MIPDFRCFLYSPKYSTKIKMECLGIIFLKLDSIDFSIALQIKTDQLFETCREILQILTPQLVTHCS